MGIDLQGDSRGCMAEAPGDRHYVHPLVNELRCMGMAQGVKGDTDKANRVRNIAPLRGQA